MFTPFDCAEHRRTRRPWPARVSRRARHGMPMLSPSGHGWPVGETRRGREAQGERPCVGDDSMSSPTVPNAPARDGRAGANKDSPLPRHRRRSTILARSDRRSHGARFSCLLLLARAKRSKPPHRAEIKIAELTTGPMRSKEPPIRGSRITLRQSDLLVLPWVPTLCVSTHPTSSGFVAS